MDLAENLYHGIHLVRINQCRLYLQVTYLSDITSVDGRRILPAYFAGKGHDAAGRETKLHWPPIGPLPTSHWTLWKDFLHQLCGTTLCLPTPLGGWYEEGKVMTQIKYVLYERRLIRHHNNEWYEFRPFNLRSRTHFHETPHPFHDLHLLTEAKVVDISRRAGSIYVILQNCQIIVARAPNSNVTTLQDLYATMPHPLQRIIGHIDWPDEATTHHFLAEANELMIAPLWIWQKICTMVST